MWFFLSCTQTQAAKSMGRIALFFTCYLLLGGLGGRQILTHTKHSIVSSVLTIDTLHKCVFWPLMKSILFLQLKTLLYNFQNLTSYTINERYSKSCRADPSKVTKSEKFTITRHTTYKINKIYSKGCREGPSKVSKITKFTKTATFTEISKTVDKINEI